MKEDERIIQIIPAEGWSVVYAVDECDDRPAVLFPLACWALVCGEDGERHVVGMEVNEYVDFVQESGDFLGYAKPGDTEKEWYSRARSHLSSQKELKELKEKKQKEKTHGETASDPGR